MTDRDDDRRPPSEEDLMVLIADMIATTYEVQHEQLTPDRRIGDFGVDSIFAGAILEAVERRARVAIDFRAVSDNWAGLTLRELATHLLTALARADCAGGRE